jgi:ATP-dependent DNA helicase DinG
MRRRAGEFAGVEHGDVDARQLPRPGLPEHKECFVLAARREALAADLVVVNHHLFFADVMLRDEGTAELLPACNTVIFDEAHQLPETASLFFGDNVSTAQVIDLARDAQARRLASAKDCLDLPKLCGVVEKAAKDLRLTLPVEPARFSLVQLESAWVSIMLLVGLIRELEHLTALLETQAQRSEGLENCWRRAGELVASYAAGAGRSRRPTPTTCAGAKPTRCRCSSTRRRWSSPRS